MLRSRWLLAAGLVLGLGSLAAASGTEYWQADTYAEFMEGRTAGISITSDGRLILSPEFKELADIGQPYIFGACRDRSGNLYLGTGHDGKVIRLDPDGKTSLFFDAEETDIFALAAAPDGAVYVGASPGGKVYRVTADGHSAVFAELKCKYIWALATDAKGVLYAATGVEGLIFRIEQDDIKEFYDSSQMHVMCLSFDLDGNLLAGTAPDGYVLRVTPAGKAESIFDAPHAEVHQIAVDRYGQIYALGIGKEPDEEKADPGDGSGDAPGAAILVKDETKRKSNAKNAAAGLEMALAGGRPAADVSGLYRLGKDRSVRTLWSSAEVKVFSFVVDTDGTVLLGTGDRGRILSLKGERVLAALVEAGQQQITGLLPGPDGIVAVSSNLGKVYRLADERVSQGEYLSDVVDAEFMARFGQIRADLPAGPVAGTADFFLRTGNTRQPDETWSEWLGPAGTRTGWALPAPPARYFQLKVVLRRDEKTAPAEQWVERVSLSYVRQNQGPRLQAVTVNPPGVIFQKQPQIPNPFEPPDYGERSSLRLPDPVQTALTRMITMQQQPKVYQAGAISLSWAAADPNDDLLEYSVYVRSGGSDSWTLLAAGLRDTYFNIGRETLDDGRYVFKVVASDAPSNPADQAREDSLISKAAVVDTTPPQLRAGVRGKSDRSFAVEFEAEDALSPIFLAEYSRDAGRSWAPVMPLDGISDQLGEKYRLDLELPIPEIRLLLIRAMDYCGNTAVATVPVP